jgi:hypothetical protein
MDLVRDGVSEEFEVVHKAAPPGCDLESHVTLRFANQAGSGFGGCGSAAVRPSLCHPPFSVEWFDGVRVVLGHAGDGVG